MNHDQVCLRIRQLSIMRLYSCLNSGERYEGFVTTTRTLHLLHLKAGCLFTLDLANSFLELQKGQVSFIGFVSW